MLMIPQTHIPPRPRLTPRRITRIHPLPTPHTPTAETLLTRPTPLAANPRLQHLPTNLTRLATTPIRRPPRVQIRVVPLDALRAGRLELDAQLAEESGVPLIAVRTEEFVCFLVGEEVEDEGAEGDAVADRVVEDPGVGRGGHGVGGFAEAGDGREDVVGELGRQEAVGERVEVQEEEVLGAALVVAQVAVGAHHGFHELRVALHAGLYGGQVDDAGCCVVHSVCWGFKCAGVEPLEEPLEDLGLFFWETDGLV